MPVIFWDETSPPGTESAGLGNDRIKSLKSSVRIGLDGEHVWPATGGDAGVHRLGSARPYVGAQSLVSSTGTDGRLMWASDTSTFWHVGSGGTAFIGGALGLSAGSYPGAIPQRHAWVVEFGEGLTDVTTGDTIIAIPHSGYSGIPFTVVTQTNTVVIGTPRHVWVNRKTTAQFHVSSVLLSGVSSATAFDWISIGTRAL